MKKRFSVAATMLLCLALVIGVACGGGEEEEDGGVAELKIGLGMPLSGLTGAVIGIPAKQGFELTVDRIGVFEVAGKEYRWKGFIEDNDGGSAEGGVATTTKFIFEDGVDFVHQIGGAAALASQALCEQSDMLIDMGTTKFEAFGPDHPYTTQTGPCLAAVVAPFYDWIAKAHPEVDKVVIGASDSPVAAAYSEAYESKMHEYFGFDREIVWIPDGTTEYYPLASKIMAEDPDLVASYVPVLEALWDMGYDGISVINGPIMDLGYFDQTGWDKMADHSVKFFFPEWYGADEIWPEAVAFAQAHEQKYGEECGTIAFWGSMVMQGLTGVLQEAGTVDDLEKIIDVIGTRTTFDSMVGPVYYGGEDFVGLNCLLMWPIAIQETVGEREYELLDYYTPEEAEAIAVEAWEATMK